MKSAVVFGSTGLVGTELVKELLGNDGYSRVTAVARRIIDLQNDKLKVLVINDYTRLKDHVNECTADTYFCCIGTTIGTAGTKENFRQVDLEIPKKIAGLAQSVRAANLVVVSSIGASERSPNFYLRTKGEMEKSVRELFSGNLKFVRPSLLIGSRREFRLAEKISVVFMTIFGWLFIGPLRKYRGIKARDVARAMVISADMTPDKLILESDELQDLTRKK